MRKKNKKFVYLGMFGDLRTKKNEALTSLNLCGGGWTRTTERIPGQIYSLLQLPLCDSPKT